MVPYLESLNIDISVAVTPQYVCISFFLTQTQIIFFPFKNYHDKFNFNFLYNSQFKYLVHYNFKNLFLFNFIGINKMYKYLNI